ncbi:hypothetical protein [Thalassoroseus pseudoceratinae]|uniref:hypothetical protein n=1 Tax=Thalassoroseus pseudoceratinae TaxID=2713176 RepID=UPI00142395E4|nr:hypothetical protein [Thalassoroseus pseudoceratinae]
MNTSEQNAESGTPSDETQWLAFRYVLGELSPEEAEAFEHSLQDDPYRCESVAIAVQSIQAIADSEVIDQPMISSSEADNLRVRWGFAAASLLACVVVICLWLMPQPQRIAELQPKIRPPRMTDDVTSPTEETSSTETSVNDSMAGQLVSLWTRSSAEIDVVTAKLSEDWTDAEESASDSVAADNEFDWMLAAVANQPATTTPGNATMEN